jgi:predicted ribosomally synthesized peptide with SipW-like signal peptide
MSDDSYPFNITRRRALGGIATFGAASAALGAGTAAYFSEEETSEDNTIQSGNIDLRTNGNNAPTTTTNVGPIAPGDSGSTSLQTSNVGSIDGNVSLEFSTPDSRNDLTEILEVTVSYGGNTVRRGTFDSVFDGEGEWSNADFPLNSGNARNLEFEYSLPGGAGSNVASQSAIGDITIHLNQQEEAFADLVVDNSGNGDVTSIQAGVDAVPPGATVLIRDGTYNEAVDIGKNDLTLASKNGPPGGGTGTRIRTSAQQQNNQAITINDADQVTIDGLGVTFDSSGSSNSEKYAIRARATTDDLTVRNCQIGGFSTRDRTSNSGAVRATGVTVTSNQGPNSGNQVSNPIIENNEFVDISCTGSVDSSNTDKDSKAKGLALNGNIRNASINNNDFLGIGATSNDPSGAQSALNGNSAEGTSKPRGISLIKGDASTAPRSFTILDNTFGGTGSDAIKGTYGQPAIFLGGSGPLGDEEVYNNVFYHPIDNLRGGALKLRDNDWRENGGYPTLEPADSDVDGGNLIDRNGGANYDTTFTI